MPHDVLSLCLDELDAPDLGRLACVSRDFRDALTPTTWRRQASKSLFVDEYGSLPDNLSRAVIAQQFRADRDRLERKGAALSATQTTKKERRSSWQEDWSLPLCSWLEPRGFNAADVQRA
ncbi:hypothetical protein T492DRAFT_868516 [Pavlovales sp. CCMP2436]|nr:hypothetical protein T492DRAFT_868516 [Pavlovales sp. CCMP2436]